jgi:hypothetical protein
MGDNRDCPTEEAECHSLVRVLTSVGVLFFHIPNGGARHWKEGLKMKRLGTKRGVPDYCFPRPDGTVLWLEMKREKRGSCSSEQKWWHEQLRSLGHTVLVVKGCVDACEQLRKEGIL